jgi:hypothetical protein
MGLPETEMGRGMASSTVRPISVHEVEVVAVGEASGWRAVVVARVDVEHGPRVLRFHRYQSPN